MFDGEDGLLAGMAAGKIWIGSVLSTILHQQFIWTSLFPLQSQYWVMLRVTQWCRSLHHWPRAEQSVHGAALGEGRASAGVSHHRRLGGSEERSNGCVGWRYYHWKILSTSNYLIKVKRKRMREWSLFSMPATAQSCTLEDWELQWFQRLNNISAATCLLLIVRFACIFKIFHE